MNHLPAAESDDRGEKTGPPKNHVILLTNPSDIYRRIEPADFIEFVTQMSAAIDRQFCEEPVNDGIRIQVACALLPGGKKFFEFQMLPPEKGPAPCRQLAALIDQMPIPRVIEGPVAFFRRGAFGECTTLKGEFGLPFLSFLHGPGMILLDDLLMEAAGMPPHKQTLWRKLTRSLVGERTPARSIAEQEVVPSLCRQLGLSVIVFLEGRVCIGYPHRPPDGVVSA